MIFINYIKSFKDFIPTWVICVFMFVGVFGWTFIIGLILLIIQCFQRKKINSEIKKSYQNIQPGYENQTLVSDEQRKAMQEEISELNALIRKQNEDIDKLMFENTKMKNAVDTSKNGEFILCAGKYKGGIDIPTGIYHLYVISGEGDFKTNAPENIYENISSNPNHGFGFLNEYRNLEISNKTILRISSSAKLRLVLDKKYDFSKEISEEQQDYENLHKKLQNDFEAEQRLVELEINTIKAELKSLNDECIKTYYKFSSYDKITSADCKNELTLLKQEESELRTNGKDVLIQRSDGRTHKLEERIVRQMLRTFNCECDNIMLNVSLKNIDRVRKQVQTSFDTLNKLYSIDGIFLTKDLLKLKLEQITLMYTYELKYQQEKDIQKAIKEQMVEEARVQREIEESKKKIDKDLQQFTGEVNRLMKYIQKTQIEAEKQIYLDKIKELEEKIKSLQSDKETALQRETNAKAGFVYIISNIGSFGENIFKIGMTRRLEPMDRIKELSSASVPFEFDVHAMIFSEDAPAVEAMLHKHFEKYSVNKINPRKEFYKLDIDEIEQVVLSEYNNTVQFTKIPLATEYRQSLAIMED